MKKPKVSRFRVPCERYFAVPNEAYEWFPRLTASSIAVYVTLFRLTWGYSKLSDTIAIEQVVTGSGLPRRTVDLALKQLRELNLIVMNGADRHPKSIKPLAPKPPWKANGDATIAPPIEDWFPGDATIALQ